MPDNSTQQPIIDLLDNITKDQTNTQLILDIANKIDFLWFEWAIKVGLVTLVFLFFKDFIYNFFYYIRIRYDKYVGIGALIKLEGDIIGRIKGYDLQYIVIETVYGFVRIPLAKWCNSNWTQLKDSAFDLTKIRKERENLEIKILEIEELLNKVKTEKETNVEDTLQILLDSKE